MVDRLYENMLELIRKIRSNVVIEHYVTKKARKKYFLPFYFFINNLLEQQQAETHYPHQFS